MGYCGWADTDPLDKVYHDTEWGIPVHDDRHMFEHLTLECMQCGLSWALMLKKREISGNALITLIMTGLLIIMRRTWSGS